MHPSLLHFTWFYGLKKVKTLSKLEILEWSVLRVQMGKRRLLSMFDQEFIKLDH